MSWPGHGGARAPGGAGGGAWGRGRLPGALGAYALAALVALALTLAVFIAHRNRAYQTDAARRARQAVTAIATGAARPADLVAGGRVSPPTAPPGYPYLRRRRLDGRRLGGSAAAPVDKLLYDAANRADRDGAFTDFADPEGRRMIAARPLGPGAGVAVAVVAPPNGPAPLPLGLLLSLLLGGALLAAGGATLGGAARWLGLWLGAGALAAPVWVWSGPGPAVAVAVLAGLVALADGRGLLARAGRALHRERVAYSFLAPAALAMLVLVAVPFAVGLGLGFYDHHHGSWTFVGLSNFAHILSGGGHALGDPLNFWFTLAVTAAWTGANVLLHVTIGVGLALMLRQPWLRARGIYRVLFILPWAIPNYITALIWNGMFQSEYGAVNGILSHLGLDRVSWFSHWSTAFCADVCANTWLGFPFMMVVALGALESIPREMHEAAEVDGASPWQRFVHVTLPHLRPAMAPAVALGAIWTFNMFNVIYLVSNGRPGSSTDILVTQAYRWAFERGERYGLAAAYATLIFAILLASALVVNRLRRTREATS